jgi:hypothetical protein
LLGCNWWAQCCYHDKKSESAWCKGCKRRAELVENFEQGVKSCLKNTPEEADLSAAKKIIQSFVPKFSIDVQYGDKINNWKKIVLLQAPGDADEFKEPLSNLVVGGTLNVSRDALEADIPLRFFPRVITPQAAMALQESGITCLDLRSNPYLLRLPTADLCTINTLRQLECSGCPRLYSPPPEVAESNGRDVMQFLRQCVENGALNESLAVVFIGDGEAGKTSSAKALMNEEGNTAGPIGKDMRTVGSLSPCLSKPPCPPRVCIIYHFVLNLSYLILEYFPLNPTFCMSIKILGCSFCRGYFAVEGMLGSPV